MKAKKTKPIISLLSMVLATVLCLGGFVVTAHAYDPIVDPQTIEKLKEAQPGDILSIAVERFNVKGEKIEEMPSWPNLDEARKELAELRFEQNNLLIEEMKQVADFEVTFISRGVPRVNINIAAGDVEKLKSIERISDILISNAVVIALPLSPTEPTTPASEKLAGDADADGTLSVLDSTAIQRYKAGLIGEDEINLETSDYDEDGEVSILDATAIQRTLAELG